MDNRKPPDTNVVRLRRNGDPSDEERQRLASTIFAEQDEVGTFSRGNLVPPAPAASPGHNEAPPAADPFFEQLPTPPSNEENHAAAGVGEGDATAAYFERLGFQTPVEMSWSAAPQAATAAMPGSANLPGELVAPRRLRSRWRRAAAPASGRSLSILRIRVAAPPLLGVLGVLVVAGAALAAIVGGGHDAPAAKRLASHRVGSLHKTAPAIPAHLGAARPRSSVRHHSAPRQTSRRVRRNRGQKAHSVLAADRRPAHASSTSSAAATPADQASSQTVQPSPLVQQPATTPVAETTSSSGSSASSSSRSRPAFGANGTLGPGHSPNG